MWISWLTCIYLAFSCFALLFVFPKRPINTGGGLQQITFITSLRCLGTNSCTWFRRRFDSGIDHGSIWSLSSEKVMGISILECDYTVSFLFIFYSR